MGRRGPFRPGHRDHHVVDPAEIGDPPDAAWPWLTRAVPSGTPLSQSIPLTMQGRIRI